MGKRPGRFLCILVLLGLGPEAYCQPDDLTLLLPDKTATSFLINGVDAKDEGILLSGSWSTKKPQPQDNWPWIARVGLDFRPEWSLGLDSSVIPEKQLAFLCQQNAGIAGGMMQSDAAWVFSFSPPERTSTKSLQIALKRSGETPGTSNTAKWAVNYGGHVEPLAFVEDLGTGIRLFALDSNLEAKFDRIYSAPHFFRSAHDPRLGGRATCHVLDLLGKALIVTSESDVPVASAKLAGMARHRLGLIQVSGDGEVEWARSFEVEVSGITYIRASLLGDGSMLGYITFDFRGIGPTRTLVFRVSAEGDLLWSRKLDIGNGLPLIVPNRPKGKVGEEILIAGSRMAGGKPRTVIARLDRQTGDFLEGTELPRDFTMVPYAWLAAKGWIIPALAREFPAGKIHLEIALLSESLEFINGLSVENAEPDFPMFAGQKDGGSLVYVSFPSRREARLARLGDDLAPLKGSSWLRVSAMSFKKAVVESVPHDVLVTPLEVTASKQTGLVKQGPAVALTPVLLDVQTD